MVQSFYNTHNPFATVSRNVASHADVLRALSRVPFTITIIIIFIIIIVIIIIIIVIDIIITDRLILELILCTVPTRPKSKIVTRSVTESRYGFREVTKHIFAKKKRVQRILASRGIIKDTAMYEKVIILSFASSNPRAVFAIKTDV